MSNTSENFLSHHSISYIVPLNSLHLIPHITLKHFNSGSELNSGPSSESPDSHSTSPGPHWHIQNIFYMITIELQYQGSIFNAHVLLPLIKIAQSHLTQSHMDIFSLKFHFKQLQSSGRVPSMIKGALKRVMLSLPFAFWLIQERVLKWVDIQITTKTSHRSTFSFFTELSSQELCFSCLTGGTWADKNGPNILCELLRYTVTYTNHGGMKLPVVENKNSTVILALFVSSE